LCESREHLQKNFLGQIFLGHAPGQMGAYDPTDQRVKVFDQCARSRLIAPAHSVEAAGQIERRIVVRHARMEARSDTTRKTRIALCGYSPKKPILPLKNRVPLASPAALFPSDRSLTFAGVGRYLDHDMRALLQALRLTTAHDL
jgi:hypothetical protein